MTHTPQDLLNVLQRQRDEARNAEAVALAELQAANRKIVEQAQEIVELKREDVQQPKPRKPKPKPNGKEART